MKNNIMEKWHIRLACWWLKKHKVSAINNITIDGRKGLIVPFGHHLYADTCTFQNFSGEFIVKTHPQANATSSHEIGRSH